MEMEPKDDNPQSGLEDLHEAVNLFSEHTDKRFDAIDKRFEAVDRRFDTLEQKIATLPTRTEIRELVQDVVDRSWDRALAKIKQVDMHVDATVDTLADREAITADDRHALHAMQPFPKLVKDA